MMRSIAVCIVASIPLLTAPAALAQTGGAATGKVVGSRVFGPQGKTVIFTDAQGKWSLYTLPAGNLSCGAAGRRIDAGRIRGEERRRVRRPEQLRRVRYQDQ